MIGQDIMIQASQDSDPARRIAFATIAYLAAFQPIKVRKRKPFNPMLGETYELVTKNVKFIAEKTQHIPRQIEAFHLEGQDYIL